eukprot:scaffold92895_cov21-Prasinocladus_malaysianus.AAC.1
MSARSDFEGLGAPRSDCSYVLCTVYPFVTSSPPGVAVPVQCMCALAVLLLSSSDISSSHTM